MGSVVVDFYKTLLGKVNMDIQEQPVEFYEAMLRHKLPPEAARELQGEVTREEIRSIFMEMASDKAPGPDGYPADFYKADWSVVGKDVEDALLHFFGTSILRRKLNSTIL
ncbi:unnamed protein product [Linum trigynum]|uniref:CNGC5-like protein n=1 Tax=Linum trigynum TaxID=586398 RepID=A0AAV2EAL7_9ROSI